MFDWMVAAGIAMPRMTATGSMSIVANAGNAASGGTIARIEMSGTASKNASISAHSRNAIRNAVTGSFGP